MSHTAVQDEPKGLLQGFNSSDTGKLSQALSDLGMPSVHKLRVAVVGIQSSELWQVSFAGDAAA